MGIPVATVTSAGTPLPETVDLLSIEVRRELGKVPEATLVVLDGSVPQQKFELSNLAFFEPGKNIAIAMRYEGDPADTPVFEGLVVRHAVESGANGSTLRVELKDAAFKLTRARKTAVFRDTTDADAIAKILGAAKGSVAPTTPVHPELIQYNATDWDFIAARAEVLGLALNVHLGKVSVSAIALGAVKKKLQQGLGDVSELSLEIDAADQWAGMQSVAWDPPKLAPTAPEAAAATVTGVGNLEASTIATALGGELYTLLHPAAVPVAELKAWADARLLRSRFMLLRGRAVVGGDPTLAPLDTVEILGVGDRFDGKALVSAVTHSIDQGGWQTELGLGLSPEWFARRPDMAEVAAGGMLPPVRGLQIATVGGFEKDKTGQLRVKVKLAAQGADQGFVWARLAMPDAGDKRGFVFRPEPGDEVVLGFLDDDPRQAVVLGALHGSKNVPPKPFVAPDDKNVTRAIVSRAGTRIVFDDEKPSLTLETTADGNADGAYKNRIVVDEAKKLITIEDQHGNVLKMDDKGITLTTKKDFTVDAAGKVVVKGGTVDIQ